MGATRDLDHVTGDRPPSRDALRLVIELSHWDHPFVMEPRYQRRVTTSPLIERHSLTPGAAAQKNADELLRPYVEQTALKQLG